MVQQYEKPELVTFATDGTLVAVGRGKCETGSEYSSAAGGCVPGCIAYNSCGSGGYAGPAPSTNCNIGTNVTTKTYNQCCTGASEYIQSQGPACVTGNCAGKGGCNTGTGNSLVMNCS